MLRALRIPTVLPGVAPALARDTFASLAGLTEFALLLGALLQASVRIFEFQPTMYHPKLLILDDVWASFSSATGAPRTGQRHAPSRWMRKSA
ncbi:MAG: hypothetical protein E5V35_03355 [Mesorhizobium sp.]|nr:MAG: hypothetical protein E5V35_03355 [Mesorhizobium sp.]